MVSELSGCCRKDAQGKLKWSSLLIIRHTLTRLTYSVPRGLADFKIRFRHHSQFIQCCDDCSSTLQHKDDAPVLDLIILNGIYALLDKPIPSSVPLLFIRNIVICRLRELI